MEINTEQKRYFFLKDLLVMILDLVPTKDAVATMFLSKRWFSVWTMKQRLEYKDTIEEEQDMEVVSKKSVWWFLENSLQLHRAPVIRSLCIELGPSCPTDADVVKWVANAVDRRVLEIKLKLLWSAVDPASLPNTLYSCKSLVVLTLSDNILVDVPSSASLPSLIFLELDYVVYKDDDSLVRLLASCPILATLCVKRNDKDDNVTSFRVEMPNLSSLSYTNYRDGSGVGDTGRYLVIVTPALTHFDFRDSSGDSCSMELPGLDSAVIDTASYYPGDKFLRSLSSVSYLALYLTAATVVCYSTLKFSRLIECEIVPEETDWVKPTLLFLENSPKLKTLVIHCVRVLPPASNFADVLKEEYMRR
ncbi:PREDICTED: putative FBD-associated F-box protein At1g05080 [Camelina sativa]|uniref:FBD-associated F-box protein At1g05080 n=1 Tax=Camelina sativa TaxID=90675 RepID=A0ABM0WA08_CAMSA|nr:PREDICTED: putative FBD-associated F-box protein At1g05080 [Camelina sativa]